MTDDEIELTKAELLTRIETGWEEFQEILMGLDEEAMTRVNPSSGWAIKDHLTHLAAWEQGVAYLLTGRPRHEGMGLSEEQWRKLTMDETNEAIYRNSQGRSGVESLAALREGHMEMLNALDGLNDADLMRDYSEFDEKEAFSGRPIIGLIIGDTYGHYEEHFGYIRAALAR